jgi:hypothetical protein
MQNIAKLPSKAWVALFWSQYSRLSEPLKEGFINLVNSIAAETGNKDANTEILKMSDSVSLAKNASHTKKEITMNIAVNLIPLQIDPRDLQLPSKGTGYSIIFLLVGVVAIIVILLIFNYLKINKNNNTNNKNSMDTCDSSFDGKMLQWFGWRILGGLVTIITLGIFGLWVPVKIARWKAERTSFND